MPQPLVEFSRVSKAFGDKQALCGIDFAIPSGQICAVVGPNGAGKTTLFRLLMGILRATQGIIKVEGRDAFDDRVVVKRLIGYLPDEPVFYAYLSGREILELSAGMHGLDAGAALAAQAQLIALLGMTDALAELADDYSRGMKKKLGLLLALLHRPKLLVLDEPTNGLDVETTHVFYELMRAEAARGTTIVFSSHLMDQVTRLCAHVVLLSQGRLVVQGAIAALLARTGHSSFEELFVEYTRRPTR